MNQIILTFLVAENIFLFLGCLIWSTRKCRQCQQVKCIERMFNRTCQTCSKKQPKKQEIKL